MKDALKWLAGVVAVLLILATLQNRCYPADRAVREADSTIAQLDRTLDSLQAHYQSQNARQRAERDSLRLVATQAQNRAQRAQQAQKTASLDAAQRLQSGTQADSLLAIKPLQEQVAWLQVVVAEQDSAITALKLADQAADSLLAGKDSLLAGERLAYTEAVGRLRALIQPERVWRAGMVWEVDRAVPVGGWVSRDVRVPLVGRAVLTVQATDGPSEPLTLRVGLGGAF